MSWKLPGGPVLMLLLLLTLVLLLRDWCSTEQHGCENP
jgi:hypothetical protein